MSFWDFNPWDKHDVIGPKHVHLLLGALRDPDTHIDVIDQHTFVLYGPDEALLLPTKSKLIKWSLYIYKAFTSL